jgi:hypothetical protein
MKLLGNSSQDNPLLCRRIEGYVLTPISGVTVSFESCAICCDWFYCGILRKEICAICCDIIYY